MVVFVDFESEDDDPYSHLAVRHPLHSAGQTRGAKQYHVHYTSHEADEVNNHTAEGADLNGKLFASALACYPVSLSIAAHLDLNDLYWLSLTCRKVHSSLSQFARQLRVQSLHCINDVPPVTLDEEVDAIIFAEALADMGESFDPDARAPAFPLSLNPDVSPLQGHQSSALGLSGKIGQCARDLVAPCRKCGTVVCRNCAAKPPSDRCLPNRYRRLCSTCLDAPLVHHLQSLRNDHDIHETPPASSASSARSIRSASSESSHGDHGQEADVIHHPAFTSPSFLREPCTCASRGVFLCQPCGHSLNSADTTYKRVWTWRSRYSTHIGGGLGTGLGLGNQGQKCGRGEFCLERGVGGVCWVEIECSETRPRSRGPEEGLNISRSSTPMTIDHEGEHITPNRPGYLSQELEGIGGVLKKKVKKRVKVGATVYEFDDERETGKYLLRESIGKQRSWCGWCSRVCPGEKDKVHINRLLNQQA